MRTGIAGGLLLILAAGGCSRGEDPDAYGNVEATEITVSAEAAGRLLSFTATEGQLLTADAEVGAIDTSELKLQRAQAVAQQAATASRVDEAARQRVVLREQQAAAAAQEEAARAQKAALDSQLEIARRNLERSVRLLEQQAATAQQRDQAERDVRVLEEQVRAQNQQIVAQGRQVAAYGGQIAALDAQRRTAEHQSASAVAQVDVVDDRLRRSRIVNPAAGTVLVTYVEPGEFVQLGQPLYKIANLTAVDVRAYVDESQLSAVRIGQSVRVNVDAGTERRALTGTVTWIAADAEFTPTPIQTRDERADLVYAVKLRVPNDQGLLKIGMPVDVDFGRGE